MLRQRIERLLPYPRQQLFELAADAERYPEFLRWWIAARLRQRQANAYYTDQVLGLGPLRIRFGSKTILHRPERIDVTSDEPPFHQLRLAWIFDLEPGPGCKVSFMAEIDFRSRLLERITAHVLPGALTDIIGAFEARAHQLCENAEQPIENARVR
jgi:coenzyme Q-binding protein COQ10